MFLKLTEDSTQVEDVVENGVWQEETEKEALDKIKMCLRQKVKKADAAKSKKRDRDAEMDRASKATRVTNDAVTTSSVGISAPRNTMVAPALRTSGFGNQSPPTPSLLPFGSFAVNPSLISIQIAPFLLSSVQTPFVAPAVPEGGQLNPLDLSGNSPLRCVSIDSGLQVHQSNEPLPTMSNNQVASHKEEADDEAVIDATSIEDCSLGVKADEDSVTDYLLSVLALSGRTKFTDKQAEEEAKTLTQEERVEACLDIYGNLARESKRSRIDIDTDTLSSLVAEMRAELGLIPDDEKEALMEAQMKACPEEFQGGRLEMFLKCEGMNPKLAAKRFAQYWENRRELFGEKYLLRMTIGEALKYDLVALETGFYRLLPKLDVSGRPVIFCVPSTHTREGYTSESQLRAMWYVMEVAAKKNKAQLGFGSGVVFVMFWKSDTSLFDYDRKVWDGMKKFEENCWPIRTVSWHICCPPAFCNHIIKPVMMALKNRRSRARSLFHDVQENDIAEILSTFGIGKDVLPDEIPGGTVRFDQSLWIEHRKVIEASQTEKF
jgi:hypothetical protein